MKTDGRVARVREVRSELTRKGPPREPDPERFEEHTVPERDCDLIRDLLISERPETVVEVGLAYGSSALAVGEALVTIGPARPRHVIVDAFQESDWADAGWELMCRAGLDSIATLMRLRSSVALPRLVAEGVVADAAFVDGGHRFHEVFVDLAYLQEIVRPGGLIILDDYWTSSVRTAAHYFERNLGWAQVPDAFADGSLIFIDEDPKLDLVTRCAAYRLPRSHPDLPFQDFRPFWPDSAR